MNDAPAEHDSHAKSHNGVFIVVFIMLCALTALSFWIANSHLMENRIVGWSSMMAVSVAKAMLVIMFFMHLWWERAWKWVLTIPSFIMGVLLVLLLVPDVGFRTQTYSQERRSNAPVPESDAASVDSDLTKSNSSKTADATDH